MRIVIVSSVHRHNDCRVFYKFGKSLEKRFCVDYVLQGRGLPVTRNRFFRFFFVAPFAFVRVLLKRPDVVVFTCPELLLFALLWKLFGLKVVYDVHEDHPKFLLHKDYVPKIFRLPLSILLNFFELFCCNFFDEIILSDAVYFKRFKKFKDKTRIVENFALENCEKNYVESKEFFDVVYSGFLHRVRGVENCIRGFGLFAEKKDDVRLFFVGQAESVEFVAELKRLVIACGLQNKVFFYCDGFVDRCFVQSFVFSADVGLVLYDGVEIHRNKIPTKIPELMVCGVPFLVSDLPEWRAFEKEFGCCVAVNPSDSNAVSAALNKLYYVGGFRRGLGENAKRFSRYFLWHSQEKVLFEVFGGL